MAISLRHMLGRHLLFCPKFCRQVALYKPIGPESKKSLAERLKELDVTDPELDKPINIGFPLPNEKSRKLRRSHLTREQYKYLKEIKTKELELASRHREIKVPLDEVQKEWLLTSGPADMKKIASHYGIFRDLFENAFFYPKTSLTITYDSSEDFVSPVYFGNHLKPADTANAPTVKYEAEPKSLWTLILTNPDCHFEDSSCEYLHWFVGNIPENQIEKGTVVCDYLKPFPAKGTGFHRFIFILYKQDKEIDFSSEQRPTPCFSLKERTFKTFDFYKANEDFLTPAGLAFFQSDWDETLTSFFHNVLNMKEPIYEYEFPKKIIKPQKWNPHKVPFDIYLDQYRDSKEIAEEVLRMRLKKLNPFEREPPLTKFPLAFKIPKGTPSWLKKQIYWQRLRIGKYRDL